VIGHGSRRDSPRRPGKQSSRGVCRYCSRGAYEQSIVDLVGESEDQHLHIYRELAQREIESGRMTGVPIYIAVDNGNADNEVAIRLPKDVALRLLMALSPNFEKGRPV
jgi:hypothetical protein